ncbi:MAG TPA: biotin carboxylase [Flavobacteriales bacterium]|nr:biotin carboxylase [Flavobacteriales bacterium]
MRPITKVLVANRGEIALRVIRTAREMGLATVAVHSEADAHAPFVHAADEAVCVGPAPSNESYLVIERIVQAALDTGADAIHPGYGFLSENAAFAEAVEAAGIRFIGPQPHAIQVMGSKLAAKDAVAKRNIPMVPGTEGAVSDPAEAKREAKRIGFPLLIKASAGGGGKGMRAVHDPALLEEELQRAISEAERSFGDGAVFIERLVQQPRHIEIQVLCDTHGNAVHLFERECSIQRRHQKVVEEAPSALLDDALREAMGQCAIEVARSCDYVGAGTVEFLVDASREFFFLEMNTRLQVEHPVTELITGVDLVQEQIRIAEGHPLSFSQEDLSIQGHALELRVYAEDVPGGFLPSTGTLTRYAPPSGPGIRVDDGVAEGGDVSMHYDPMLAKLCTHGPTREAAIERMLRAIEDYEVHGVDTTLDFGHFAVNHEAFRSGQFDTGFVDEHFSPEKLMRPWPCDDDTAAELILGAVARVKESEKPRFEETSNVGAWRLRVR